MLKVINLKKSPKFLGQYVRLRNGYTKELLTHKVTLKETLKWLDEVDVELYGLAERERLLGAVLIYMEKSDELTFFVRKSFIGRGYGSRLLEIAAKIAKKRKQKYLRVWVRIDNIAATRTFIKNGYKKRQTSFKKYDNKKIRGRVFIKYLEHE